MSIASIRRPNTMESIRAVFRQLPIFLNLGENELGEIIGLTSVHRFPKDKTVCVEGDVLDSYFVVISGRIRAFKQRPSGKFFTIAVLSRGDTFGDTSLFSGERFPVSLLATEDSLVTAIYRDDFQSLVSRHPDIFQGIAHNMIRRLMNMQDRIADMVACSVQERVIRVLKMLFRQFGAVVPLRHQEIADMVGITRESATRILSSLHRNGIVSCSRGRLILTDEAGLDDLLNAGNWRIPQRDLI